MVVKRQGMMFVLSSPSGVGKTTLTKKLAKNNANFTISISHTTRKPRPNEINGKDYYFINNEEFNSLVKGKRRVPKPATVKTAFTQICDEANNYTLVSFPTNS